MKKKRRLKKALHNNMRELIDLKGIENLNIEIRKCNRCRLFQTRTNALCGEGSLDSKIMLIAQAPGENEDREGRMFIGPSGKVLDELLVAAGINRKEVYMTNLVKCMLPKYRKPIPEEIQTCGKYLDKEIELIDPEVLAPLGYYATKYVFERYGGNNKLPSDLWGTLFRLNAKNVFPLRHPASLLYNPALKPEMIKTYKKLLSLKEN